MGLSVNLTKSSFKERRAPLRGELAMIRHDIVGFRG